MAMKPEAVCTIESCPWNGQPMSAHPKRDRSHVPSQGQWRTTEGADAVASLRSEQQNRCGGCKHWDTASERDQPVMMTEPDYDEKPLPGTWGTCGRIPHRSSEYESDQPSNLDLAFLSDGSGYFASITTRAEFGCVMWEAKD